MNGIWTRLAIVGASAGFLAGCANEVLDPADTQACIACDPGDANSAEADPADDTTGSGSGGQQGALPGIPVVTGTGGDAATGNAAGSGGDAATGNAAGSGGTGGQGGTPCCNESGGSGSGGSATGGGNAGASTSEIPVTLVGSTGGVAKRVHFGLPLADGALFDASTVAVFDGAEELPSAAKPLAAWVGPALSGSVRSVLVEIEVSVPEGGRTVQVVLGKAPAKTIAASAAPTLGQSGPAVMALLPPNQLSGSQFAGPQREASATAAPYDVFEQQDRYAEFDTFDAATAGNWLYDRPTTFFKGYARTGREDRLRVANKEVVMYRDGISATGTNGVPDKATDIKYEYTQGLAYHYLLTGDASSKAAALRVADWLETHHNPDHSGGETQWTERNQGFALLGELHAYVISGDAKYLANAKRRVDGAIAAQQTFPADYTGISERCYTHNPLAHDPDEGLPGFGCSPWMSAILVEGMALYHQITGDEAVAQSIVETGRYLARHAIDDAGKPFYWATTGTGSLGLVDDYYEHMLEVAYVIGAAWDLGGRKESDLATTVEKLVEGWKVDGDMGHVRSFNWQMRGAPGLAWYMRP